jgi:hypothetical protein
MVIRIIKITCNTHRKTSGGHPFHKSTKAGQNKQGCDGEGKYEGGGPEENYENKLRRGWKRGIESLPSF